MPVERWIFPEAALAVDAEIHTNHPELVRILSKYPHQSLENKVAAIAAYCNIAVDGSFKEADLKKLFELLYIKLRQKSTLKLQ